MHKILLTCPPMIGLFKEFQNDCTEANFEVTIPAFEQEMSEGELCNIIGDYDGWIIGDDPATRQVVEAGVRGRLKACMRWGVGTNNIDFAAFSENGIPIENTPAVFGREVADLACHYVTALARKTFKIDSMVKQGIWYKPTGKSLWNTRALIVGFGDIGENLAKRLEAHDVKVCFTDPNVLASQHGNRYRKVDWPDALKHVDFVIFTAPLNNETFHMFNFETLKYCKRSIKLVNVARGALVDEQALLHGLKTGIVEAAALDVFEAEPFNKKSHAKFLDLSDVIICGSHNGSNTKEAVEYVSRLCIKKLKSMLVSKIEVN